MMELIFATNNRNKSLEIGKLAGDDWDIKSLSDIGFHYEIPETGNTLKDNALQKAKYIFKLMGRNCFADDTGLEINALNGAPGVFSARYAGQEKDSTKNMRKVLEEMQGKNDRTAKFRTVIALIIDGKELFFEGIVKGTILHAPAGEGGFGYDPIFKPDKANVSFAQMSLSQKNIISHRGIAVRKLADYLRNMHNK
jgi:XTP/dITP diphosphohydrolase